MKPVKWLAYSCLHAPLTDMAAFNWMIGQVETHKPNVIVDLGDSIEAMAASKFKDSHEAEWTLRHEYDTHCKLKQAVREAAPKGCRLVYLPGNHEDNIMRPGRLDKAVRGVCNWADPKNQPELTHWHIAAQYKYCRVQGCFRIGQVCFAHGYEHSGSGDENQALYLGNEYGLTVLGHTHRPTPAIMQCRKGVGVPLRYYYANAGTLRQMDADYMSRKRKALWGQAVVVGEALPVKSPRMTRCWSAHVELFRMYDDSFERCSERMAS